MISKSFKNLNIIIILILILFHNSFQSCTSQNYQYDQSQTSNQCTNSCQCNGSRTCSSSGYCQGISRSNSNSNQSDTLIILDIVLPFIGLILYCFLCFVFIKCRQRCLQDKYPGYGQNLNQNTAVYLGPYNRSYNNSHSQPFNNNNGMNQASNNNFLPSSYYNPNMVKIKNNQNFNNTYNHGYLNENSNFNNENKL